MERRRFVEGAVSATASGDLNWNGWSHDYAMAIGLSGHRNPLGFAVVDYLANGGSVALWRLLLLLATRMIGEGVEKTRAHELAFRAVEWWNARRCLACGGSGVVDVKGTICDACAGTGERPLRLAEDGIQDAVSALIGAEQFLESQLRARLRGASQNRCAETYAVRLPKWGVDTGVYNEINGDA